MSFSTEIDVVIWSTKTLTILSAAALAVVPAAISFLLVSDLLSNRLSNLVSDQDIHGFVQPAWRHSQILFFVVMWS
jgi:hypothetical protein